MVKKKIKRKTKSVDPTNTIIALLGNVDFAVKTICSVKGMLNSIDSKTKPAELKRIIKAASDGCTLFVNYSSNSMYDIAKNTGALDRP